MALLKDSLIAHYKMNENTSGDNAELVINGTFDADTGWTKGDGWSIAGGVASCDGTQIGSSNLTQVDVAIVGNRYKVVFTVSNYSAGGVRVYLGSAGEEGYQTSNGTYTVFLVCTTTRSILIKANSDFVGDIDNVSVKFCAVEDSSGNDHDGIAQRQTSDLSVPGKVIRAFDFNGTSDYINIGNEAGLQLEAKLSYCIWVKTSGTTGYIFSSRELNVGGASIFMNVDGKIDFRIGSTGSTANSDTAIDDNEWHFVCVTFDNSSNIVKYYLDGRPDGTGINTTAFNHTVNKYIGFRVDGGASHYFDGLIDDVMVFDKVLTLLEIKYLYNSGGGVENIPTLIEMSRTGHSFSSRQEI